MSVSLEERRSSGDQVIIHYINHAHLCTCNCLMHVYTRSYYLKIVEELKICVLYLSAQHESDIPTVYMYVYVHACTFTSKLNLHTHMRIVLISVVRLFLCLPV